MSTNSYTWCSLMFLISSQFILGFGILLKALKHKVYLILIMLYTLVWPMCIHMHAQFSTDNDPPNPFINAPISLYNSHWIRRKRSTALVGVNVLFCLLGFLLVILFLFPIRKRRKRCGKLLVERNFFLKNMDQYVCVFECKYPCPKRKQFLLNDGIHIYVGG